MGIASSLGVKNKADLSPEDQEITGFSGVVAKKKPSISLEIESLVEVRSVGSLDRKEGRGAGSGIPLLPAD